MHSMDDEMIFVGYLDSTYISIILRETWEALCFWDYVVVTLTMQMVSTCLTVPKEIVGINKLKKKMPNHGVMADKKVGFSDYIINLFNRVLITYDNLYSIFKY